MVSEGPEGKREDHADGADVFCRIEPAEADGAYAQDIAGIYRDECDRTSKKDGKEIEGDCAQHFFGMDDKSQPFLDTFPGTRILRIHDLFGGKGEKANPCDDDISGDNAESEQVGSVGNKEAGGSMAGNRGEEECAGIEGDGTRQLFLR